MTPNSGCTQNGQAAGSDTSAASISISSDSAASMPPWEGAVGLGCSGGCGSGRLIWTKHSEQID